MSFTPVAIIESPFKEKFGIPRQPGLAPSVSATVRLQAPFDSPETVKGLEQYSHIWLLFIFSACVDRGWKPSVRPPRLGGNEKLGVFASRSPFRPNPIGMSVVKLEEIIATAHEVVLTVSGADLLDGTPIIDIKPYVPYSDALQAATTSLATPVCLLDLPVIFSEQALARLNTCDDQTQAAITEILRCDPRPAYQRDPTRVYGLRYADFNIRWAICDHFINVVTIEPIR